MIHRLTEIEPNESPVLSCFVDLDHPRHDYTKDLDAEARIISRRLGGRARTDFEDALAEVKDYLAKSLKPESKSAAIYARWGDEPVFVAMQFEVPIQSQLIVDELPHVYPLIELKDTYHRFVIVITTEEEVRIMETSIGAVTSELMAERPELRQRVGREWSRNRYRNHKRDREGKFVREKVRLLESLMAEREHSHLIIAGSPKMVSRLTLALPQGLRDKLITSMASNPKAGIDPIVLESINLFVAAENIESHDVVEKLTSAVMGGGLGVAGYSAAREALLCGYADVLVISTDYELEAREELVRLAAVSRVEVETVRGSEALERLSGVGCLLRYHPDPERSVQRRMAAAA
jgi:ribosomal protein L30E